ncbi:MAG: hypothetical protein ACD_63C00151G0001 [uncultured bacterium]|nr:MAG: hypothetical protein ACD_63C00151G0001 [uncultured bacterium]
MFEMSVGGRRCGLFGHLHYCIMLSKICKTIEDNCLLSEGDRIIAAISGGADSVALFLILDELKKKFKLKLVAAHVNYGVREEAGEDENFVRDLAKRLKVECEVLKTGKPPSSGNFEAWARDVRYDFFEKVREKHNADKIAVAHTRDDQVETVLLNFLRGAGPLGLAGMRYRRGRIIRPFLDVIKTDLVRYINKRGEKYRVDKTNINLKFKRNWIRHKLLPYLRENFNENICEIIFSSSKIFAKHADFLREEAEFWLKKNVDKLQKNKYSLKNFFKKSPILQGEIIRTIIGVRDIGQVHIGEILDMLKNSEPGRKKTFKKITIQKTRDNFLVIC